MKELIKPIKEEKSYKDGKVQALCETGFKCNYDFRCQIQMNADQATEEDILF